MTVEAQIRQRLEEALAPQRLDIMNDSAAHAGHAGDNGTGESHFSLFIVSDAFEGKNRVARQRMVYQALGDLMQGTIHALALRMVAPSES